MSNTQRHPARCQLTTVRGVIKTRGFLDPRPERSQRNPEQPVQATQSSARPLRVQSEQLPTESQVFEDEVLSRARRADDPPEEMPERHNHGKNIIGTIRLQFCAKFFILQIYDVLARHSYRALRQLERNTSDCNSREKRRLLSVVRVLEGSLQLLPCRRPDHIDHPHQSK